MNKTVRRNILPFFTSSGFSAVRYYSIMNPWLDFIVVFDEKKYQPQTIAGHIMSAMNEYWESDDLCYGDLLEIRFKENNVIDYMIIYHDDDDESPEYENAWESWLKRFGTIYDCINMLRG